jgi:hypothetical protein
MMDFKVTTENLRILMSPQPDKDKVNALRKRMLQNKEIAEQRAIQMLEHANDEDERGEIYGPPFWVYDVLSKIEDSGKRFSLGAKWRLTTGGGWKGLINVTKKAFKEKVVQLLGIPEDNYRDVYGSSERKMPFPACEGGYFHIMHTFVHPFVLDNDLNPVGYEEYGRLACLEAIRHGFPGYIITGDRVKMYETCPECDRPGPVIEPSVTRMPGVEDRGCAGVMHAFTSEEIEKA